VEALRFWLSILASLFLSGCALLRHDAVVLSVFPDEEAFLSQGIDVDEAWAK
jgi:hypothetical protein